MNFSCNSEGVNFLTLLVKVTIFKWADVLFVRAWHYDLGGNLQVGQKSGHGSLAKVI